jgi:formylglycine-generating enzyme required for sulfatase activity
MTAMLATGAILTACSQPDQPTTQTGNPTQTVEQFTTPSGVEMVLIPAGSFMMGSERAQRDARPPHLVRLAAFYIDRYEVTQAEYEKTVGDNPSSVKQPTHPVEQANWVDAVKYCNARSRLEGLQPCYDEQTWQCDFGADGYRLPTEAEWEYACRAGTSSKYSYGENGATLARYAWYNLNSDGATHPVGAREPNAWGLHDMHGNVWEWCHDLYDGVYYGRSPAEDPPGPAEGDERVLRGGGWTSAADACSVFRRDSATPGYIDNCLDARSDDQGFRCVKNAIAPAQRERDK